MRSVVLLSLATLTACASASTSGHPNTETVRVSSTGATTLGVSTLQDAQRRTVAAPFADVWRVLPSVLDSLGIPITTRDAATGQVGTTGQEVRRTLGHTMVSRYFACGNEQDATSAVSFDLFLTLMVQAQPVSTGGTSLAMVTTVRAKPITYSGGWIPCESRGLLEQRIVDEVTARTAH